VPGRQWIDKQTTLDKLKIMRAGTEQLASDGQPALSFLRKGICAAVERCLYIHNSYSAQLHDQCRIYTVSTENKATF